MTVRFPPSARLISYHLIIISRKLMALLGLMFFHILHRCLVYSHLSPRPTNASSPQSRGVGCSWRSSHTTMRKCIAASQRRANQQHSGGEREWHTNHQPTLLKQHKLYSLPQSNIGKLFISILWQKMFTQSNVEGSGGVVERRAKISATLPPTE